MLVGTIAFSIWAWTRPYESQPDPSARATIRGIELERDHAFYWVTVQVASTVDGGFDLTKPVYLRLSDHKKLSPADTRLSGSRETGFSQAWYQFWVEVEDSPSPWKLEIQDGVLLVKSNEGIPQLEHGDSRNFTTHHWKRWIGF